MGLKGFVREPRVTARERRNSVSLASEPQFVGSGSVIILDGDGILQLNLDSPSGLENNSGALRVDIIADSGLEITTNGIQITERHELLARNASESATVRSAAYAEANLNEAKAIAFFQGQL